MNTEIERKFLIKNDSWKQFVTRSYSIKQGYFSTSDKTAIRVRISDNGSYITIKLPVSDQNECPEFEYDIPLSDAEQLIGFCQPHVVEKTRHEVFWDNRTWEVDIFENRLAGFEVAEIELSSVTDEIKILPPWVGREVTKDVKFTNKYMAFNYQVDINRKR